MDRQHQNLTDAEKGRGEEERAFFSMGPELHFGETCSLYCEGAIDKDNGVIQW